MKKALLTIAGFLLLVLLYRSLYCYRIIAISNSGNLKYKEGNVTYFSRPPLSIVNPFKKRLILQKIQDYCGSGEFETYHQLKEYYLVEHRDYFAYKQLALNNALDIKAAKSEEDTILFLVTAKADPDLELVFMLDTTSDKIVGYF